MGRYLLTLFVASVVLRAALVLALRDPMLGPDPSGPGGPTADDVEFDSLARHVAAGEGYVNREGRHTSFRAPGWPFFLAALYAMGGDYPPVVYAVNCLLGGLSCVLTYLLARHLFEEQPARVAGWLAAFYLPHAWFATQFYSENLFAPLLGAATLMVMRSQGLAGGLLLGLAILTRPFALLLAPLWIAWLAWGHRWSIAALLAIGAAAVVGPWTYRNSLVHGQATLVATNGGSTFYGGNNSRVVQEPRLWGSWVSTVELPRRGEIEAQPTEVTRDRMEWRLGLEWATSRPLEALISLPMKLLRLIFWLPDYDAGRVNFVARCLGFAPYLPLLLIGYFRAPWLVREWQPAHAVLIATVMTALIFWGSPRFRDANLPVLMLYACAGLYRPEKRP
jgi:4-amino-4-deoxy-L-arabinose transferase-like glycosyltransferase